MILPQINIGQLETKLLVWTTVLPKVAKGFIHLHIALLPSTQLATKLLDMAPVFYFPWFYCAAGKLNLLFYSAAVKKRLTE